MELTKRQQEVARTLARMRADLILAPDASDEAREIGKRIDAAQDVARSLLSERAYHAVLDASIAYRDTVLESMGYVRDRGHGGWRKNPRIDPVYVGQ